MSAFISVRSIVVPYELYELYDRGKVPELYILLDNLSSLCIVRLVVCDSQSDSCSDSE